jgi:hypothetical protein
VHLQDLLAKPWLAREQRKALAEIRKHEQRVEDRISELVNAAKAVDQAVKRPSLGLVLDAQTSQNPALMMELEMARRLNGSIEALTVETVGARKSAERVGRLLVLLTVALVLLTAVLVALTVVLAIK